MWFYSKFNCKLIPTALNQFTYQFVSIKLKTFYLLDPTK